MKLLYFRRLSFMKDYLHANQKRWDQLTIEHEKSEFYDLELPIFFMRCAYRYSHGVFIHTPLYNLK